MPLSKLFQKRNSLKDKKASNSSNTGPCSNETASTSTKTDQKVKKTVNEDSIEQLPTTSETVTGVICDSKEKAEQQPSSTIETVKDSPTDSSQCEEVRNTGLTELSYNAKSILEVSSECKHGENPNENSTSKSEILIEVPTGMKNEQVDNVDSSAEQALPIAETVTDVASDFLSKDDNNAISTSTEKLSPATDSIIDGHSESEKEKSVNLTLSELPYPTTESIKDASCDSKDEVTTVDYSVTEKISLKHEKNPDIPHEITQSENQLTKHAQEQKDELVLNSKETGYSNGASINSNNNGSSSAHCELGQSNETVEMEANIEKTSRNKSSRASSFKEAGSKPAHPKTRRRKCESESAASNSNSTDDEGFDDRVLHFREKDLEEVIGKCVSKLIRESIAMAVRNVDVDGLYEEVIKTISDRSQSESSNTSECPGTVEQKLHTNSVKEYADLEMLDTFEDSLELRDEPPTEKSIEEKMIVSDVEEPKMEIVEENDCAGEKVEIDEGSKSGIAVDEGEEKDIDLDGYRADLEESASLNSFTKETINENNVSMANIENIEQGLAKSTNSDDKEEASSPFISKEMAKDDENTPEIVTAFDSKSPRHSLNEGANEPSHTEEEEVVEGSSNQDSGEIPKKNVGMLRVESEDLISMSDDFVAELHVPDQTQVEEEQQPPDLGMDLPQQNPPTEEGKKVNWKVGYLDVKLPPKSRGKGHLKAWKKRCVAIHPDEFANDPRDPWLMISVYSGDKHKHSACFWKSVGCRQAVVYRSSSGSRRHAFTVADDGKPVVHLAADSEALSQEWMAAARAVLWPPSPVVQLEKMLNGSHQFEVSLIDNEFSYRAGLLGAYGHLTITPKKLILVHPQQGYVLQEWYLNTVDKFELMPQTRIEDAHKVLCMTTCSDSSTGRGEILIFCREALALLQSLASTIHQILTHHSRQEGGKYQKELEEMAEWLVPSSDAQEELYKVPPRQVRSLLDIPNFIFDKPLTPIASVACPPGVSMSPQPLLQDVPKGNRASQDSGISAGISGADDFLNCSTTSFVVGGGGFPKSSDSELSDSYTPPVSPKVKHEEEKTQVKT